MKEHFGRAHLAGLIAAPLIIGATVLMGAIPVQAETITAVAGPKPIESSAEGQRELASLIKKAKGSSIAPDKDATKATSSKGSTVQSTVLSGSFPTRRGTFLVEMPTTNNATYWYQPYTGHAAMVYSQYSIVESLREGVRWTQARLWAARTWDVFGGTVIGTSVAQDSAAGDYAARQAGAFANYSSAGIGKPYNSNFYDVDTRSKFYCSQLVWAAFKDTASINLDTSAFLWAIHPYELIGGANPKIRTIYHAY
ncbi:YiiX/YebB-like N1pC/P60 family cysteine hydrolase [Propioniciclava tarda]|nr:YiiX/YebB-like N1pC/P60 family cysteine hydrolase [Propioniciclava tarda]SMO34267.1 Uncharacterized protein YycO [Propioniciclava tarda]